MFTIRSRVTSKSQVYYRVEQFIDEKSQFPVAINGEHIVTVGLSYQSPFCLIKNEVIYRLQAKGSCVLVSPTTMSHLQFGDMMLDITGRCYIKIMFRKLSMVIPVLLVGGSSLKADLLFGEDLLGMAAFNVQNKGGQRRLVLSVPAEMASFCHCKTWKCGCPKPTIEVQRPSGQIKEVSQMRKLNYTKL